MSLNDILSAKIIADVTIVQVCKAADKQVADL